MRFDLTGHYLSTSSQFTFRPDRSPGEVCIEIRDRQLFSDIAPEGAHVRKDIRRPRFSFFRFNCQTARRQNRHTSAGKTLSTRLVKPGGFRPEKLERRLPAATCVRRRRWTWYSSGGFDLSTRRFEKTSQKSLVRSNSGTFSSVCAHPFRNNGFRSADVRCAVHAPVKPRSIGFVEPWKSAALTGGLKAALLSLESSWYSGQP